METSVSTRLHKRNELIRAALTENPSQSQEEIARMFRVSSSLVSLVAQSDSTISQIRAKARRQPEIQLANRGRNEF